MPEYSLLTADSDDESREKATKERMREKKTCEQEENKFGPRVFTQLYVNCINKIILAHSFNAMTMMMMMIQC